MHVAMISPKQVTTALLVGLLIAVPVLAEPFSHELPWTGTPPVDNKPVLNGLSFRDWMTATKFKSFKFSGTLGDAITQLMIQSKTVSPDGRMVGGFVLKEPELTKRQVAVSITDMSSLQLINELCRQAKCTWSLSPFSIIINSAEVKKP